MSGADQSLEVFHFVGVVQVRWFANRTVPEDVREGTISDYISHTQWGEVMVKCSAALVGTLIVVLLKALPGIKLIAR